MPRPFGGGGGEVNAGPGVRVTPGRAGLAELPLIGISVNSVKDGSLLIIYLVVLPPNAFPNVEPNKRRVVNGVTFSTI